MTRRFPRVAAAAKTLGVESALLDGEVAVLLPSGLTSFQLLQNSRSSNKTTVLYCFDLIHLNGEDVGRRPLIERLELLRDLLRRPGVDTTILKFSDYVIGDAQRFFEQACRLGAEGIVSKLLAAQYQPGRSKSWLKIKCKRSDVFVIAGYTVSGPGVGALLLGQHEEQGRLLYAGSVGTGKGFNASFLRELRTQLERITQPESPLADFAPTTLRSPWGKRRPAATRWVRPLLVAEVTFTERTDDGLLRHPSFAGFRKDIAAEDVVRSSSPLHRR